MLAAQKLAFLGTAVLHFTSQQSALLMSHAYLIDGHAVPDCPTMLANAILQFCDANEREE